MSILVDEKTRLLVQGITGREGMFHTEQAIAYGTNVVAGVTPGKGGQSVLDVPVFDTVKKAVDKTKANATVIFVPPAFAADAILEAADTGVELIICISEGIPVYDNSQTIDNDTPNPKHAYFRYWNAIYAAKGLGWESSPWVWVVEFERVTP